MNPPPAPFPEPAWTESMLAHLGLQRGAAAAEVYQKANDLATRLAPNTRRLWRWILLLEGLAVLLPLCWLMVAQRRWPAGAVSVSVALCTVAVVGFCWWLRWRNQQHAWTRSRLLAEIARSAMATAAWPGQPTRNALDVAPSLQALADVMADPPDVAAHADLEEKKAHYLAHRIDDQSKFYTDKAKAAAIERQRLSKYVTRSLDGALVLAVLGLWLGFSGTSEWLLSVANADLFLGLAGAALPLTAILMQSLSSYLELNRRTGRFAQQWEYLEAAKVRLQESRTLAEAEQVVQEVERALLSEVTEWFYQTEHSEVFYRTANMAAPAGRQKLTTVKETAWSSFLTRMLDLAGVALSATGRIIFGRLLIVAITSVLTSLLIFSRAPQDGLQRSILRLADGQLLSRAGPLGWWKPDPKETERGFILIAHGLNDSALVAEKKGNGLGGEKKLHWMTELQGAIKEKLHGSTPDICLVDWSIAAKPSEVTALLQTLERIHEEEEAQSALKAPANPPAGAPQSNTAAGSEATRTPAPAPPSDKSPSVTDIVAIRMQAQAIGDIVGYKLAQSMKANPAVIHQDRPMHLIGHSAGGFLVVRAALVLKRFGLLPGNCRVTLLDTPLPDLNDLNELLAGDENSRCQVDFYKSSFFAQRVPAESPARANYRCYQLFPDDPPQGVNEHLHDHSYAHQWFISSVRDAQAPTDTPPGFRASPFWRP